MASSYCYTEDLRNLTKRLSETHSVTTSAVVFSLGVGGNLFAIFLLVRHSNTHHWSVFYRLVGGLAATDLFGILSSSPLAFVVYSNDFRWVGGQPTCDYMSFVLILSSVSTMLIATSMSVDRFLAVWFPFVYKTLEKRRRVHVILASLWIFAFVIASLPLFHLGHNIRHFPCTWCFFDYFGTTLTDIVFSIIYASLGVLTILVSSIINILVLVAIAKEVNSTQRGNSMRIRSKRGQKRARRNEIFIMTFIIAILLTFACCWMPLMIRVFTNISKQHKPNFPSDLLAIRFATWNQILDPWIYIVLRKEMLTRFYNVYRRLFTKDASESIAERSEVSNKVDNRVDMCMSIRSNSHHDVDILRKSAEKETSLLMLDGKDTSESRGIQEKSKHELGL